MFHSDDAEYERLWVMPVMCVQWRVMNTRGQRSSTCHSSGLKHCRSSRY